MINILLPEPLMQALRWALLLGPVPLVFVMIKVSVSLRCLDGFRGPSAVLAALKHINFAWMIFAAALLIPLLALQ